MDVQVNLTIEPRSLKMLYEANQRIAIFRQTGPAASQDVFPKIAWIVFSPFQNNCIEWSDKYYLYASSGSAVPGRLEMNAVSRDVMQPDWSYTFENGAFVSRQGAGKGISLMNNMQAPNLRFGLAQGATVNGVSLFNPLNIVPLLYREEMNLTPDTRFEIALSSCDRSGSFAGHVRGKPLAISPGKASMVKTSVVNVGFNPNNNRFYLINIV
jgi:hypothetical protein